MSPGQRQGGVTLIELLVALVLLSVIMSAVYGTLRVGLRSWDAVQDHSADAGEARVVRNLVRRQLEALVPMTVADTGLGARLAFEGEASALRFVGAWRHPARPGGLYLIELEEARSEAGEGEGLWLRFRESALHETDWRRSAGEATERELVSGLDGVRFAYYGTPRGDAPPDWHRQWDERAERYPRLVRLEAGDGWPPLVIPVRVDAETEAGGAQ